MRLAAGGWRLAAGGWRLAAGEEFSISDDPRQLLIARFGCFTVQVAVEQHVAAHAEDAVWRARAVADFLWRCEPDRRRAAADDQRGNRDVQPIEQSRLQERGHGDAASFDENPRATT